MAELREGRANIQDFARGRKRTRRDFARAIRRVLRHGFVDSARLFEASFEGSLRAAIDHLAAGFSLINVVGLRRDQEAIAPPLRDAFHMFHESLNLLVVALHNLRSGCDLAALGVTRQAIEMACVGAAIARDPVRWRAFHEDKLDSTKCVSIGKRLVPVVGRLYGMLSNLNVHPSRRQLGHSLRAGASRIAIGAGFDPERHPQFAFALLQTDLAALCVHALAELSFLTMVEQPIFWILETAADQDGNMRARWNPGAPLLAAFERFSSAVMPASEPLADLPDDLPPADRREIERLVQTYRLRSLADLAGLLAAEEGEPTSVIVKYLVGVAMQNEGDVEGARRRYGEVGDVYDVAMRMAWLHEGKAEYESAIACYVKHVDRHPNDVGSLNNLAVLLDRMGRYREALARLDAATARQPGYAKAHYNRGNAALHLELWAEAVKAYEMAGTLSPSHPDPWHSRGVALLRADRRQEAYRSFRHAVTLDGGYFPSWINLGALCLTAGQRRKALLCFKRAHALIPDSPEANRNLAVTHLQVGDAALAERHARAAVELGDAGPDAWEVLAEALEALGRSEEAAVARTESVRLRRDGR